VVNKQRFITPLLGPIDFPHLVTRIAQSSHGAFYRHREGRIGRVLRVNEQPRFVEVGLCPLNPSMLAVTVYDGIQADEHEVRQLVSHLFSLETDLLAFYEHSAHDPRLQQLVTRLSGARMLRDADLFSSVISSVISQQINLKFAAELKRRLWCLTGERVLIDGEEFYADPTPGAIAQLSYDQLRQMQYSQRKAEYVIDFARSIESGQIDLGFLANLDDEEFILHLSRARGLGRWTAECVLLFGLGRPDLLPANDVGLQKAVSSVWGIDCRITEKELREKSSAWKPWSSWYTYYLWLSLAKS